MKDFRALKVWQKGMELFEEVVKDVDAFPKTEVAKIISNQIIRSVSSITANIAEGYGRRKGKEFEHYLYISRGSANETIDWYEKLKRLGYIDNAIFENREQLCQ
jgi:four helix bundle protein